MGGAIVRGLLRGKTHDAKDITVADPSQSTIDSFAEMGVNVTTDNRSAVSGADTICVVVKPWLVETVLKSIKPYMDYNRQTVVVVAAGITSEKIKEWLGDGDVRDHELPDIFLAIPNIAIAELSSMTFIVPVKASANDTDTVKELFDCMGSTIITEERLLAAGTTLASCGIAYAMRYIRAAAEGGVELGFKADEAKSIVLQTVKGAVDLLIANGNHPEVEIDKVTTPGGVTIKGLNEMEHAGFTSAVIRGLKAGMK